MTKISCLFNGTVAKNVCSGVFNATTIARTHVHMLEKNFLILLYAYNPPLMDKRFVQGCRDDGTNFQLRYMNHKDTDTLPGVLNPVPS